MTAHLRFVNYSCSISNGDQFVDIAPGWEVAPANDPNVLRVCGEHPWQGQQLVLADGGYCHTKLQGPSYAGDCARASVAFGHVTRERRKAHCRYQS
jgi:hypothetical protein